MPINLSDFTSDAGLSANVVPITAIPTVSSTHVQGALEELQLDIASIPAALTPKGTWNALTNIPVLVSSVGNVGDFYVIDTNGTTSLDGTAIWSTGDNVFFGADNKWHKVSNNSDVTTVFGRLGNIVATLGDYSASLITNTPSGEITSTNVQNALNELDFEKQVTLISGSNIKTVNGTSLLGSGDIPIPVITVDTIPTDASNNAVSSNGVFDALATKEPVIIAGTTSQYYRGDKTWQILPAGVTVEDLLTSTSSINALSANQGKILNDADITSGAIVGSNLVLTLKGGGTITIDATTLLADVKLTSGVYNSTTKTLDLTLSDTTVISIPVSSLLPVSHDLTLTGDGATTPLSIPLSTDLGQTLSIGTDGKLLSVATPTQIATVLETETGTDNTKALSPADGEAVYLKKSLLNTKGDLIVASADNTPVILPVGTTGQALVSDSNEISGLKWTTVGNPNVRYGTVSPTVLPTDKIGDEYFITTSGDNTTAASSSWVFDGTIWTRRGGVANLVGQIAAFASESIPTGWLQLNGQTITGGAITYPILANIYPTWVSGSNLILPNYNGDYLTGTGGYFLRGKGTRTVGSTQTDLFKSHNHQGGDITANQGDKVLAQVSAGTSNTASTSDTSPGELNLLNNYTMIPMEGGVETRPVNVAVIYCVSSDALITDAASVVNMTVNQTYTSFSQVYTQAAIPTITVPPTSNEGDIVIVTSDGTSNGTVQNTWVHNGTAWQLMHSQSTALASVNTIRTYYPSTTALQAKLPITTAPMIAGFGFTAVGTGATIQPDTATLWNGYGLIRYTTTQTTQAGTFTIPTSYIRHELAVDPTSDNTYFLQVINETPRDPVIEVWLCNPTTGVPVERLYANCTSAYDVNNNSQSYVRSPKGESAFQDAYREWLSWQIPASSIATYKTATNTIKLAFRTGVSNGAGVTGYISGFAMAKSNYNYTYTPYLNLHWTINETVRNAANGGNVPTGWGLQGGMYTGYTPVNTNRVYRIPITDTSKDIYLNVMGLFRPADNIDGLEYCLHMNDFTIINPGGNVLLGRPNLDIVAPSASIVKQQYRPMGWIIPAATLASKVQTVTNSAVKYLYIKMDNQWTTVNSHFAGFITENIQ